MIVQKCNTKFGAIKVPDINKFFIENAAELQGMVEVDWEEKKLVFSPFMDLDLISISYEQDFLRHVAAMKAYMPINYDSVAENFNLENFDILDIKNKSGSK